MKCKILIFIFVLAFFGPPERIYGQVFEKNKSIAKAFQVTDGTEVNITNKYGNIHLVNWEQDSVKFEVEVTVTANKQHKVDRTFDYIDFTFKGTKFYVIAETIFKNEKAGILTDISDFANAIFKGGTEVSIDYTVYLPEDIVVKINNKFGNVYATTRKAKTSITLSNGDLKAHNFIGPVTIDLKFGNASIKKINNGDLSLHYGELELDKGDVLNIVSKSTTIRLEEANSLNLDSRRDKIYIDELGNIQGKAFFSYLKISELTQDLNLNTNYGDLKVNNTNEAFSSIQLVSTYTDVEINIPADVNMDVDLTYDKKTNLNLPVSFDKLETVKDPEDSDRSIKKGVIGEDQASKTLKINQKSGTLLIIQE